MEEWVKKLQENSEINTQNQSASLKKLETQIEQLTKEFYTKVANEINNSSFDHCKVVYTDKKTPYDNGQHEVSFDNYTQIVQEDVVSSKVLPYLGASVNLIPKTMFEHLKLAQLKKTDMLVEMADMTKRSSIRIVENVLVKIDRFLFPSDFVVMDMLNTQDLVKDPRERSFDDYKWMFDLKIDQLADEYELGIGKKGHMLDDIWENCKKVQGDNTYWWHDQKSKGEERRELGINIEEYDPPIVHVETFEIKRYSFDSGQNFICVTKELMDTLPLGRENGARFRDMIRKEVDSRRRIHRMT
ncbi:RNA-directed DNA polymerase, eukaryota, reverse transcriptase zinc-binding domain protein [Tanacetum coccineum]